MNLDELIKNIQTLCSNQSIQELSEIIKKWKTDERNIFELQYDIEKFLKERSINNQSDFTQIHKMWSNFKNSVIDRIGGMTMNERLYWFGLFDLFDSAKNTIEKDKLYKKLMAKK